MPLSFLLLFICSFLAFALSAVCGGGAGLMLIPILGGILPVTQIPAALSIGTFTSSASRGVMFFSKIRWDVVRWFVPAALPAVWLGAWLLKFVNPMYLELAMGLFLTSNLVSLFKKSKEETRSTKKSNIKLLIIGFLAGFLSGLTGAVGLLFNKFYLQYGLSKEEIVATRAANELLLHLLKIVLYTLFGLLSSHVMYVGLIVAASAILSTWSMKWILPLLSDHLFKKIGYTAMVVSGMMMLSQSSHTILVEHKGNLSFNPVSEGLETKLQWQRSNFSLEFAYDEGFEFEQVIPLSELPKEKQDFIMSKKGTADNVIVEATFGIGDHGFEAYYFEKGQFKNKIDFK
jgi:uncharacterized membrane protein YfcA